MSRPIFAALLPIGALAASAAGADGIERAFSADAGGTLVVEAESATVEVRGGSDNVQVRITRGSDDAADIGEDFDVTFDQDGDTVYVQVERKSELFWARGKPLSVTVATPTDFNAKLRTTGGDVHVTNLSGALDATTSGGDVGIEDVQGPLAVRTSGGDIRHVGAAATIDAKTSGGSITIGDIRGAIEARTSGGTIVIDHAGGPVRAKTSGGSIAVKSASDAVDAHTSGGSIEATFQGQPRGDSRLKTSGGSITAYFGPDAALDVNASASGGRVRVDGLRVQVEGDITQNSLQGTVNGGGAGLSARTSGGSITLAVRR